jgi:hypothetical protein
MTKIGGSGSINQRHGSANPDQNQNVINPQHCCMAKNLRRLQYLVRIASWMSLRSLGKVASCEARKACALEYFSAPSICFTSKHQGFIHPLQRINLYIVFGIVQRVYQRLNMELDLQSLHIFGLLCSTAVLIGWDPAPLPLTPLPRIWTHTVYEGTIGQPK